jgi:hypothetical protein
MVRLLLLVCATVAGCKNFDGPCAAWRKPRHDQPGLSIEEQERRARDKFAIPEDDFRVGPNNMSSRPTPAGR